MLKGKQMQTALINAGLAKAPKPKQSRDGQKFNCRKCGSPMIQPADTNVMSCSKCNNFYIFDK